MYTDYASRPTNETHTVKRKRHFFLGVLLFAVLSVGYHLHSKGYIASTKQHLSQYIDEARTVIFPKVSHPDILRTVHSTALPKQGYSLETDCLSKNASTEATNLLKKRGIEYSKSTYHSPSKRCHIVKILNQSIHKLFSARNTLKKQNISSTIYLMR